MNIEEKNKKTLAAQIFIWLPLVVFSYIAIKVAEQKPLSFDTTILSWIHAHSSHALDTVLLAVTTLGNVGVIAPVVLLVCAYLFYKKHRQKAVLLGTGFFGAAAINVVLKAIFHRDRPDLWHSAIHETGYSFPSGHAMLTSALIFGLIVITWKTWARWWAVGIGLLFVAAVGYSRLYLGVHYPTDILAGWLVSLAWVSLVAYCFTSKRLSRFV